MPKVKLQVTLTVETTFREAVLTLILCFKRLVGFFISPIEQVTPQNGYAIL